MSGVNWLILHSDKRFPDKNDNLFELVGGIAYLNGFLEETLHGKISCDTAAVDARPVIVNNYVLEIDPSKLQSLDTSFTQDGQLRIDFVLQDGRQKQLVIEAPSSSIGSIQIAGAEENEVFQVKDGSGFNYDAAAVVFSRISGILEAKRQACQSLLEIEHGGNEFEGHGLHAPVATAEEHTSHLGGGR